MSQTVAKRGQKRGRLPKGSQKGSKTKTQNKFFFDENENKQKGLQRSGASLAIVLGLCVALRCSGVSLAIVLGLALLWCFTG